MKTKLLLLLSTSVLCLNAQIASLHKHDANCCVPSKINASCSTYCSVSNNRLSAGQLALLFKSKFSTIANNNAKTTVGNFASADLKEGKVALNGTKNFNNGDFLSLNINSAINEGFFSVFSENKISANTGLDIKYSHLCKSGNISWYKGEIEKLHSNLESIKDQSTLKMRSDTILPYIMKQMLLLDSIRIFELNTLLNAKKITTGDSAKLSIELMTKLIHFDSLNMILLNYDREEVVTANQKKMKKQSEAAILDFGYNKITLKWFSIGAGLNNNSFKSFSSKSTSLDSQITKQNYTSYYVSFDLNYYRYSKRRVGSFYALLGGKLTIDDNFGDLTKVELKDVNAYSNSTIQRTVDKKTTAYEGAYKTNMQGARTYLDIYKFIFKNNGAIHLFSEGIYKLNKHPLYNGGFGLLYSFIDSKDEKNKARVNAEIYYKLTDLGNSLNATTGLAQRNELGVRLTIPINFFN